MATTYTVMDRLLFLFTTGDLENRDRQPVWANDFALAVSSSVHRQQADQWRWIAELRKGADSALAGEKAIAFSASDTAYNGTLSNLEK